MSGRVFVVLMVTFFDQENLLISLILTGIELSDFKDFIAYCTEPLFCS
jgi:hypothetical protein